MLNLQAIHSPNKALPPLEELQQLNLHKDATIAKATALVELLLQDVTAPL